MNEPKYKCSVCGHPVSSRAELFTHRKEAHGLIPSYKRKTSVPPSSGIALLTDLQKQTRSAVEQMETERDLLHQRLIEMDNTIARYKKLLLTQ